MPLRQALRWLVLNWIKEQVNMKQHDLHAYDW